MLNIYFCGSCKKCLPKENFYKCDMCKDFIKGKCECGCYICDICYDFELTKCYSYKTGELTDSKKYGYYMTICLKCEINLNSPFTTNKNKQIIDCIVNTYPKINFEKDTNNCCCF